VRDAFCIPREVRQQEPVRQGDDVPAPDGKLLGSHDEAKQFETHNEAEAKAFSIVMKHPSLIGMVSVVRSATF
jgi:hypothetical protein